VKNLILGLLLTFAAIQAAQAADPAPASEASIRKLLEVTESRKLVDGMWEHVDASIDGMVQQVTSGQKMTPEQRKIFDDMRAQMFTVFKEQMNWEFMEKMMLDIYGKSFTQSEVDGMLEFYATPAGRSLITKMPVVMKHTMTAVTERLVAAQPRLQQIQRDAVAQLQATK
jgi:uncharacterized protein